MKTPVSLLACVLAGVALTGCGSKDQPASVGAVAQAKPAADPEPGAKPDETAKKGTGVLDLTVKDINGKDVNLVDYKGKVVLIVNVASKCGYTPQYAGLEKLYKAKKEKGFVILGFPADNFGHQEPGTDAEIKAFCTGTYNVDFPMFSKVEVKGEKACELYKRLAAATPAAADGKKAGKPLGEPGWNFTKYLVNKNGEVVAKFDSGVKPEDAKLDAAIEAALAPKSEEAPKK